MVDRRWIRNIEWADWTLLDSMEFGDALMLVVSHHAHNGEPSIAACQPLAGWYVSSITRLRNWLDGASGVPGGRVFYGRVPAGIVEVRLTGLRVNTRAEVRPLGVWAAVIPGRRHFRRVDFLNAAGEVARSFDYVDGSSFWFGRVGGRCRRRWGTFRLGHLPFSTIDRFPDWESRLTA